jgi:hypothetical protein
LEEVHLDVELSELLELGIADKRFKVGQKLESFFIGNLIEGVVRVVTTEDGVQRAIGIISTLLANGIHKRGISELSLNQGEIFTILNGRNLALNEYSPAFIEPEVFPVSASDGVSSPAVNHLVSGHVNLGLVTNNDSG